MADPTIPGALWYREPPAPRWWDRRARVAYGLLILGIGLAGDWWANDRGDDLGHAISELLLLTAGGVIAAALLAPIWPTVARALAPAGRLAASVRDLVFPTVAAGLCSTGRVIAAVARPIGSAISHMVGATCHLLATACRPIFTSIANSGGRIGRRIAVVWPVVAAGVGASLAAAARLLAATWRPLWATTTRIASATATLVATVWPPVAATIRTVVTVAARLLAATWRPLWATTTRVASATATLAATVWPPVAATIRAVVTAAARPITATCRPLWAATTRIAAETASVAADARDRYRARPSEAPSLRWLVIVELILVVAAFGFSYVWTWWLDGERITGEVIEATHPSDGSNAEITIRDPDTEIETVVHLDFDGSYDVGDTATAVVMRSDPSKVATSSTLVMYLVLWTLLPVAAVGWPIWWWRAGRPEATARAGSVLVAGEDVVLGPVPHGAVAGRLDVEAVVEHEAAAVGGAPAHQPGDDH